MADRSLLVPSGETVIPLPRTSSSVLATPALAAWETANRTVGRRLRQVERLLRTPDDGTAAMPPGPVDATAAPGAGESGTAASGPQRWSIALGWWLTCLALTGCSCGAALAAWGVLNDRAELWEIGVPIVLVSQASLVGGLLMFLVWARRGT